MDLRIQRGGHGIFRSIFRQHRGAVVYIRAIFLLCLFFFYGVNPRTYEHRGAVVYIRAIFLSVCLVFF